MDGRRSGSRRAALVGALVANGAFVAVQVVAAIAFGSLVLLTDAVHNASDVLALGLALVALVLAARPPSSRHTYGLARGEVLAAELNAAVLLAASVWIAIEAVRRFSDPGTIVGGGVTLVGAAGIAVNAGSAWVLRRVGGSDLGIRAVFWHLVGDALGSVAAVVAGVAILVADATWVDPAASLFVTLLIVIAAIRLMADAGHVLLEGVPSGIDVDEVERSLTAEPGVGGVHHTHVWALGTESVAMSAHVELAGEPSLHDAQSRGELLRSMLAARFGIEHATLELECHDCVGGGHGITDEVERDR